MPLADDLRGDACGLTDVACPEIAADTTQHDRLRSVSFVIFTFPFEYSATIL